MNIALILNTKYHVEVAVSLYFSVNRIVGMHATIIPLLGDHFELFDYLDKLQIRYQGPDSTLSDFQRAIVISAYPIDCELPHLPLWNHPVMRSFEGRRILITHRTNKTWHYYRGEQVVSLSPLSIENGIPFIYLCENPILATRRPITEVVHFLVQGKFDFDHRNFEYLTDYLSISNKNFRLILLGSGADKIPIKDDRVLLIGDVSELEFYKTASECAVIIPLVDYAVSGGNYLTNKFSSSLHFSFSGYRSTLIHGSLGSIYPVVGKNYENRDEFRQAFDNFIDQTDEEWSEQFRKVDNNRQAMRKHNSIILKNILVRR